MESSRASLTLQGFLPAADISPEELEERVLCGRYAELRMLYYIGKDLTRWMEQCVETTAVSEDFYGRAVRPETFAVTVVDDVPAQVRSKLEGWGVLEYRALFMRGIGLQSVFAELPLKETLRPDFLRRYHRYVDLCYEQRLRDVQFDRPAPGEFTFELFASGEYTLMLEQSWGAETAG